MSIEETNAKLLDKADDLDKNRERTVVDLKLELRRGPVTTSIACQA